MAVDTPTRDTGEDMTDLAARRPEVVRRLLDRGIPSQTLKTILPGWEHVIEQVSIVPGAR